MKKPELLAPGGSFHSAYYALEAGADGVYLGLSRFSARASATNFTVEQLRRIRGIAGERGRRIYVAINTVVKESELARLAEDLFYLETLGIDGVIVQDLGVLSVLRSFFPRLPVHASTQMAIHNASGVEEAERLGVKRVILSRELSLERIRSLRKSFPRMELEVFIHGALCYGFSGMCLASWDLTGRSGNRGECAQVCRSLFHSLPGAGEADLPADGYFFSSRDLFLGNGVLALAEAGVDALKIEGRMKSPEYVFHTVRLYRRIIDRGEALPEAEYRELEKKTSLAFARRKTTGYLRAPAGTRLIDSEYPGHRGILLGRIGSVEPSPAQQGAVLLGVVLESDLSVRDGLALFGGGSAEDSAPFIFSLRTIMKGGRSVRFARAGESVQIEFPAGEAGSSPAAGRDLFQLSSRFLDLPQPKEASFPLYKAPVDVELTLEENSGAPELVARLKTGFLEGSGGAPGDFRRAVTLDKAVNPRPLEVLLNRLFSESGGSLFTLRSLSFVNSTGRPGGSLFIPPSELKRVKNDFYGYLESLHAGALKERREKVAPGLLRTLSEEGDRPSAQRARAPAGREARAAGKPGIPFADLEDISGLLEEQSRPALGREECPVPGEVTLIPMPPVMLEEESWKESLRRLIASRSDRRFAVGLSNISHLVIADALAGLPNVLFFVDYPLYVANRYAYHFLARRLKGLMFEYFWIEGSEEDFELLRKSIAVGASANAGPPSSEAAAPPSAGATQANGGAILGGRQPNAKAFGESRVFPALERVSPGFRPPLFYSLGCLARHVLKGGACVPDCPREFSWELSQGKNRFVAVVRDCVTYLFRS